MEIIFSKHNNDVLLYFKKIIKPLLIQQLSEIKEEQAYVSTFTKVPFISSKFYNAVYFANFKLNEG